MLHCVHSRRTPLPCCDINRRSSSVRPISSSTRLRGAEHALAGGRQHHALAEAEKQLHGQPRLDVAQLVRERRLRQMQPLRRARDAAGRGDLVDEREMTDFEGGRGHGPSNV